MKKDEFKAVMDALISVETDILNFSRHRSVLDLDRFRSSELIVFERCHQIVENQMKALYEEAGPSTTQLYFDNRFREKGYESIVLQDEADFHKLENDRSFLAKWQGGESNEGQN